MTLTKEKALQNIRIALNKFVGTRDEHIALDESFILIEKEAMAPKVAENAGEIIEPTKTE